MKFSTQDKQDLLNKEVIVSLFQEGDGCIGDFKITINESDLANEGKFFINKFFEL